MTNIEWSKLPFGYLKTNYNIRAYYREGEWSKLEISDSEYIPIHMAATALHYGQQAFEGLKAYMGKDGRIRLFRWEENAKRMQDSANGVLMAVPPTELFKEAITTAVKLNKEFVPPYGTGASLYIRPLLIGNGPRVGVKPADEYMFLVFVSPVGPYFKEGFNPVSIQIAHDSDRAAPLGTPPDGSAPAEPAARRRATDDPRGRASPRVVQRGIGVEKLHHPRTDRRDHDGHCGHAHLADGGAGMGAGHDGATDFHARESD